MQEWQQWEMAGEAAWGVALHRETVIRPLAVEVAAGSSDPGSPPESRLRQ
jgi:hypothetical protein